MPKIKIVTIIAAIFFISCHPVDKKVLQKSKLNNDNFIEYEGSSHYGNFINAVKSINGIKMHYNIKISNDGELQHILKYNNEFYEKNEEDINYYRSLQLLITDTSMQDGPTFFGHPINGYYRDTSLVNNVLFNQDTKAILYPLAKEEKELFSPYRLINQS